MTGGAENFGFGECQAELCVQAAIDESGRCRYHGKVLLGLTVKPGRESDNLTRVPRAKARSLRADEDIEAVP
jgi:hypothetical protein